MKNITIQVKKIFRPLFYKFWEGRCVTIKKPKILHGLKWIIDKRFGRAYYGGYYEVEMVKFLLNSFKDGDAFLDIGGHAGYFSYIFSRLSPSGQVLTFEPDPQNAQFIRRTLELNNIKNIRLFQTAVGSRRGTLFFEEGPTSSMGRVSGNGSMQVTVAAIDDMFPDLQRVDLIKIDVEGFGAEVIEGAKQTILKHEPTIFMEIHDHSDERQALANLRENGYKFYNLQGGTEDIWRKDCRFYVAKRV